MAATEEHTPRHPAPADRPREAPPGSSLRAQLLIIAELLRASHSSRLCVLAWTAANVDDLVGVPASPTRWDSAVRAALDALKREEGAPGAATRAATARDGVAEIVLSRREIAALDGGDSPGSRDSLVWAASFAGADAAVRAVLVADADRHASEIKASLKLAGRAALAAVSGAAIGQSRIFWRSRATSALKDLARARSGLDEAEQSERSLDEAASAIARLNPRARMAGLGAAMALAAGCDRFIVAAERDGALAIAAASPGLTPPLHLTRTGALALCHRRRETIESDGGGVQGGRRGGGYAESRLLRSPWIALPLGRGAIVLASRSPLEPAERMRAEALAARVEPILRAWAAEDELGRYRALVQRLALRMFGAIDDERARIARDLHDDQAQLLTAARLALEGGRDEAREIFRRLERELRDRIHCLRPASLGHAALGRVLRAEAARLKAAGIRARLTGAASAARISRPVQQLCVQVLREALSNVIRHARATEVEIALVRRPGAALLTVSDNGRGIQSGAHRDDGAGLAGITERLELMGGRLTIDSRPGATRLVAEIPEPQ
jgi:signal transduction histidine kinase